MLYLGAAIRNQTDLQVLGDSCLKGTQATDVQVANCKRIASAGELLLEPGKPVFRLHDFFFGIPLLILDLTLPPASPPRSRGLQRHLLSPSRGRSLKLEIINGLWTPQIEILNGPLDTSKLKF